MNPIVLKQNSPEIRQKIKDSGIDVCICAEFVDACWLDCYQSEKSVHGVGYTCKLEGFTTQEQVIAFTEYEWNNGEYTPYFCKDVDEFIEKIKESKAKQYERN